jgi:type IV secretory pathway component VirB8
MDLPHAPNERPYQDTALRNESASETSWKVAMALVVLTVIAVIVLVVITT